MLSREPLVILLLAIAAIFVPLLLYRLMDALCCRLKGPCTSKEYRIKLGSLALFGAVALLLGLLMVGGAEIPRLPGLLALLSLAVGLGAVEEIRKLPTQFALSFRFLIGTVAFLLGLGFRPSGELGLLHPLLAGLVDYGITVLFYGGVIYTVQLLDGLRGLASGIVAIVALTLLSLMFSWRASGDVALLPVLIASLCVGHLLLLGNDEHLQLGAVGQMLAGVLLASTTVTSRTWGATLTMLFVPLLACSVPIAEHLFSQIARLRSGDVEHLPAHLHKLLVRLGFKNRWVVLMFWAMTAHVGVLVHVVHSSGSLVLALAVATSLALVISLPVIFLLAVADHGGPEEQKRLRILFFSHYFYPEVNAPASRLHEHARRWRAAGHQVTVVCPVPSAPHGWPYEGYRNGLWDEEVIEGVRVIRIWTFVAANRGRLRRTLNYVSFLASSLVALVFIRRHDVLVSTSPQFFCGLVGAVAKSFRRERIVLEVRDIWPESIEAVGAGRKKLLLDMVGALARWMYRRSDHIVTVGEGYRRKLLEIGAAPEQDITVIPNGIDFDVFGEGDAPVPALFQSDAVRGKFVVSYVGTLGMAHGLEVVLEAAEAMRGEEVAFLLVGDGANRKALEAEAQRRRLDNVVFTGLLPKQEIPGILARSSATLVHLRKTELFTTVLPSKLFEGMALAKPVLLGVRGDAERLLRRADGGICLEPEDAAGLCAAIRRLAADPAECRRLGANGRRFVEAEYNRDRLAREYVVLLQRLVDEPPRSRRAPASTPLREELPSRPVPAEAPSYPRGVATRAR